MSEHITQWLSAYLDGELHGERLRQVEAHLEGCPDCQAGLQSLRGLSDLLKAAPAPVGLTPAERFTSQVLLRLPPRPAPPLRRTVLEAGWWLAPAGILAAWVFVRVVFWLSGWVWAVNQFGLLGEASAWLAPASNAGWLTAALSQTGFLSASSGLQWAKLGETIGWSSLSQISWQVSMALLYLGWLAAWWTKRSMRNEFPGSGFPGNSN